MANNGMILKVGLDLQTNEAIKTFNDWSNRVQAQAQKNPIKINVDLDGQKWEKTIQTFVAKNGDLVESTRYVNLATKEEYEQITKVEDGFSRLQQATAKQAKQNDVLNNSQAKLNSTTKHSVSIFQDFTNTFLKMAKFNTINLIYDGIISKMSEAIQITNDFDAAMTEFKKVTDTTNLSLSDYTEQLGELGEATARTTTQMLQSATEFSKAGFTPEDSAKLAQVASLYQNIADAEISAGEAASFITSQIKAYKDYGVEASNATQIIDKLNEVSNNFSVSSSDIASALTKQSASLAAYGNNLNESIALVTAGTEIMTGQAGKVSRGLRTIGANITQLAQKSKEFDITVNGATKTIQLWNETGTDMLNTYDVLKQISAEWDNMTNAEKSSLAIDLAKKTQMDTFLAVLGNFEDAEKAYTTALLSEGSAWKENEKYMESIEAHQAKLKQAWEQLVLSKPIEDLEKALLNAGTALIQFANSGIGQTIIKVTALLGVIRALQVVLQGGSGFAVFINLLGQVIAGETTLTAVTAFLTTTLLANPLFWGAAAVLGITAIAKGVDALIVSFEEATEALEEVNQALSEQENQIKSLNNTISNLKEQLEEVNEKKLEITDPNQLQALERESKELARQEALAKSQLAIEQKKLEILQQEALTKADEVRNKNQSYNVYDADKYVNGEEGALEVKNGDIVSALTSQIGNIDSLNSKIADLTTKLDALKAQGQGTSDEALEYADNIQELNELLLEEERAANSNAEALLNVQKANGALTKSEQEALDLYTQTSQATEQLGQSTKLTEDDINDFVETWGNTEDAVDGTTEAFEKAVKPLSDIENNYSLLSKAVQEFNEKGGLSANTVKKLSELDEKWVSLLELKNGKLTLSKDAVNALAQAEQQDAIASLQAQAAQDMHNVALGNLEALSPIAKSAIAEVTQATQDEANAATQAAAANFLEAESLKAKEEAAKGGHYNGNTQDAFNMINAIMSKYQGMIDNMNSWTLDFGDTSSSTAGSTKDAWVEAFKEEQRQLKHSLEMNEITELEYYERLKDLNEKYFGEISGNHQKYIKEYQENEEEIYKGTKAVYNKVRDYLKEAVEQGYEKAINALKKEEKAVLAEIKKQIEGLKREKKAVLDGIKDEINALKKQKEQVQKYYNDQIDAIKKENEVLQEQNQLLEYQQQLQQAKAQKVMVMQDGKFQLGENESAVAQAEQNLNNYKDQLSYEQQIKQLEELRDAQVEAIEARIQSLEEYYDYMEDYYDRQIEAMEDYYDRVQEQYEKQIEALQEELDTFKDGYKKAEDLDNARLAAEVMAANEEASVWRARLDNLAEAISEYNRLLSLMGEEGVYATSGFSGGTISHNAIAEISGVNTALEGFKSRASGDASFASNEVALVGESPNTELVLGSKLNHSLGGGELVHLSKGSGVVNAESTRTLAGLLNGLANPQSVSTNHTTQQTFTFGSISLPNVTNAETFVGALRDKFNNYSIQSTTIKK